MIQSKFALAIHGGAGTITRLKMLPEKEKSYKEVLSLSLLRGQSILSSGGSAMEAIVSSIQVLEDSPLFNAGKGAVFTNDDNHELDASIMDGQTLEAGAVAGLKVVKNPIKAAYAVLKRSEHVFLVGEGGDKFAKENGCDIVDNSYFSTEHRKKQLDRLKAMGIGKTALDHNVDVENKGKIGTVGAVALDKYGNIAAGTSTGGLTNKKYGRIGDSPIIGAGTYANNNTCAVSCTGIGEYFIRKVTAYDVSALMEYKNMGVIEASNYVINVKMREFGGEGGLIAIDREGNIAMPFNSEGMYRGFIRDKEPNVCIYEEEK